jgi:hypothetical protein
MKAPGGAHQMLPALRHMVEATAINDAVLLHLLCAPAAASVAAAGPGLTARCLARTDPPSIQACSSSGSSSSGRRGMSVSGMQGDQGLL